MGRLIEEMVVSIRVRRMYSGKCGMFSHTLLKFVLLCTFCTICIHAVFVNEKQGNKDYKNRAPDKVCKLTTSNSTCVISSPNPMYDDLLESSQ